MAYIAQLTEFMDNKLADTVYYPQEEMSKHTTFKTGGPADLLIEPHNITDLQKLMKYIISNNIPYIIIGRGSNILVGDKGIREVVIKIDRYFSECVADHERLDAQAGAALIQVAKEALHHSLSGLEFACGIPGTVGGAVYMNAGAYGVEIKDVLEEILVITSDGELLTRKKHELEFAYRSSSMQRNGDIIVKATFRLRKGEKEAIEQAMNDLTRKREASQPAEFPSAGSTFKRPEGYFAGKLIQDANLKGYSIGGAQVSLKHAGFVINTGTATSRDILNLIKHIQAEVKKQSGVELEPEVRMIGEF